MWAERGRCGREVGPQEEVHIQILETERAKELVEKKQEINENTEATAEKDT